MEKSEFELQCKTFTPLIKKLIEDNIKFYRHKETVKWTFGYDEDASIMAVYNRNTNVITLNLKSVIISFNSDCLRTVEYYLLHEIRHKFQNSIIKDYKEGLEISIDKEIVERWIYESEHYVKSCDERGNENPEYFLQDSEMDAYAYSLAVMKYKYKDISDLYVPYIYGDEFKEIINSWLDAFEKEKL